jgi:DNA-binding XRE family transcriptional regulator
MSLTFQEWRRLRNISKKKMAELLGIHENTYRNWENNPKNISILNAFRIADVLGVDMNDIKFCEEKE